MKKILLAIIVLPLMAHAQNKAPQGFLISGAVNGLVEHSMVCLVDANNPSDTLARSVVRSGAFTLKGHVAEPNMFELDFSSPANKLPLFIGNDKISISGSAAKIKDLKVSGSPSNDDLVEFQRIFNPYFLRLNTLGQLSNSPAGQKNRDSISRVYTGTVSSLQLELDQFLKAKKSSFVSPFILVVVSQLSEDVLVLERRYNTLSAEVQAGYYGKYLKEQIDIGKIGAVGTTAIEFTQGDTTGNPVSLSAYKGKYVLVDFWASWCHPCRLENPNVVATYAKFRDKNFAVLGVSLDRAREPWIKAISEDHLDWTQVSDLKFWNNEVAVKYKISSIPQNYLIDPSGKIVGRNLRGPDLEAKLCELLGCN